ncbi:MAG: hypothetical protein ACUVXA_16950 [Candidatus Jordarchaeum sp.]|uniref:hypothetical protein n=1 Tax=Candidatus Jordarchaeum sp. TaxID=2823881 RepID=UPI00404979BC
MFESIFWKLEKYGSLGAWILICSFAVIGSLLAAILKMFGYLHPFTIISIVVIITVIPGVILAVLYLDYLKEISNAYEIR